MYIEHLREVCIRDVGRGIPERAARTSGEGHRERDGLIAGRGLGQVVAHEIVVAGEMAERGGGHDVGIFDCRRVGDARGHLLGGEGAVGGIAALGH